MAKCILSTNPAKKFKLNTITFSPNPISNKYTFISKLSHYLEEDVEGNMSKIFVVQNKVSKELFICKRVTERKYCENEWKLPKEIHNSKVIHFNDVYYYPSSSLSSSQSVKNTSEQRQSYYYFISPYYRQSDLFTFIENYKTYFSKLHKDIPQEGKPKYIPIEKDKTMRRKLFKEMAECIKACHDHNIVHLDIKLENFIIKKLSPLELVLIDFGFAEKIETHEKNTPKNIKHAKGTLIYRAPEIYNDYQCYLKSDVFSLGMTFLFILNAEVAALREKNEDISTSKLIDKSVMYDKTIENSLKNLLLQMLRLKIKQRIDINQVLNHPYFTMDFNTIKNNIKG